MEQADRHRRRGAESGTGRRDIGEHGDLDPMLHPGHQHGLAHKIMLQILDARNDFLLRVVDVDVVVEALLDDDIDILVDGTVQDPTAVLEVVVGKIGATADQADAQRSLGDDHEGTLGRQSSDGLLVSRGSANVTEVALHAAGRVPARPAGGEGGIRCPSEASGRSRWSTVGLNAYMPALARSLVGSVGFSVNPVTRPPGSTSTTPQRDGCSARKTVKVASAWPLRWNSIRDRRSKSVKLSALTARKNSSSWTQARWCQRVPALPSRSARRPCGWPAARVAPARAARQGGAGGGG